MTTATLAHIAAHGVFRSDNPMFSTLQMSDGPLFVHEMDALSAVPETVVLAACSSGRSGVLPGDELLGTAAVLMGAGVRTVIAPLIPIADDVSTQIANGLHTGLRSSQPPAAALAAMLRAAVTEHRPRLVAALSSYTCVAGTANEFTNS
jgi:CHAT domain-containing protein